MDGRALRENQYEEENENEYDPRKHKIPQGIRSEWFNKTNFIGKSVKIGK